MPQPFEEFSVSMRMLDQLRVWSGDQDCIILGMVNHQDMSQPAITASVVVNHIRGPT